MLRRLLLPLLLLISATPAAAASSPDEVRQLLQTQGVHAIMRHALAPGYSDPANFDVDDCNTQRNLSASGREQARRIGARLRELGAAFTEIRTSQWCRCEETAQLLDLGKPVQDPVLNSFFENRSSADAQTGALKAHLASLPPDQRVFYVTHQVNITALTGEFVDSGEVFLIRLTPDGDVKIVGSFLLPAR